MGNLSIKKRFTYKLRRMIDKMFRSNAHQRVMKAAVIMICLIISAVLAWLIYLETP